MLIYSNFWSPPRLLMRPIIYARLATISEFIRPVRSCVLRSTLILVINLGSAFWRIFSWILSATTALLCYIAYCLRTDITSLTIFGICSSFVSCFRRTLEVLNDRMYRWRRRAASYCFFDFNLFSLSSLFFFNRVALLSSARCAKSIFLLLSSLKNISCYF